MKTRHKIMTLAMMLLSVWMAASCSEDDNLTEEYPDWQNTNEAYFNRLSDSIKALLAADPARTDWKRIKTWSKAQDGEGVNADYIIVHVLNPDNAPVGGCPLYTDTVAVSYVGSLLPSVSYPQGLVFDRTYTGTYDEDVSASVNLPVGNSTGNSLIDGFATALQHMHRGDHWMVYIPHQLGYGATGTGSSIPPYSTLRFDIILRDFWSPSNGK